MGGVSSIQFYFGFFWNFCNFAKPLTPPLLPGVTHLYLSATPSATWCYPVVSTLQAQRKLDHELELRRKAESSLGETKAQLQAEISTRVTMSSNTQHANEKNLQLDKQVCRMPVFVIIFSSASLCIN